MNNRRPVEVTLDWEEVQVAAMVAVRHHIRALDRGYKDPHNWQRTPDWNQHIEGRAAELAVSIWSGYSWSGLPLSSFHKADVGPDIQVRLRLEVGRDLGIRATDDESHRFVLVYGAIPRFTLAGWIDGRDGKTEQYRHDEKLFYVPVGRLHPMDTFVRPGKP